jgi:bis(5'-nucleosyl)-tetraphosphatase (symmetrical)
MPRTIVIGDVHGCVDELRLLLNVVEFNTSDRLLFTGDLVDRGPDSISVVRLVRSLGALVVLGNHDSRHVRWAHHEATRLATGKPNPMRPYAPDLLRLNEQLVDEGHIDWFASLPLTLQLSDRWLLVHAGMPPQMRRRDDLMYVRFVNPKTGAMMPTPELGVKPPGTVFWTKLYSGNESIIYGHNVDDLERPRIDRPQPGVTCVGIDTGCVFGGHLTCAVLHDPSQEAPTFIQVPALRMTRA